MCMSLHEHKHTHQVTRDMPMHSCGHETPRTAVACVGAWACARTVSIDSDRVIEKHQSMEALLAAKSQRAKSVKSNTPCSAVMSDD